MAGINHSIAYWCCETVGWTVDDCIRVAKELGCSSVELTPPESWPKLKENGLTCAITLNRMPGAPFVKGLNNLDYHDEVIGNTKASIDDCVESDGVCSCVIAFTGYKWRDAEDPDSGEISLDEGFDNCVKGLRIVGEYAASRGVSIALEQLNTRDDTHPMKGHPGYMGDDTDWVADVIRAVDMDNVKYLFDVYHVQIMNGDVIRRIHQYKDILGHVHAAGCPGRAELHIDQEINYPAVMKALLEVGYEGYVGQEFIPTGDLEVGLREAIGLCDV